jgi:hypothetical protein
MHRFPAAFAVIGVISLAVAYADDAPPDKRAKVVLCWVESKQIIGLTEDKGFQSTCDPKSIVYPHKKPALVLTAADVEETRLTKHDFSESGSPGELYSVTFHFTKAALAKLAATCESLDSRELTVVVDGKYWGVHRYEKDKDKPSIPEEVRAETFRPSVGYLTSKAEAERLANAFK